MIKPKIPKTRKTDLFCAFQDFLIMHIKQYRIKNFYLFEP